MAKRKLKPAYFVTEYVLSDEDMEDIEDGDGDILDYL